MSTNKRLSYRTMCIGNGQVDNAVRPNIEVSKTLNCMDDPMKIMTFRKTSHPKRLEDAQGWEEAKVNDTLNVFDNSATRTPTLITQVMNMKRVYDWHRQDTRMKELGDICVTAAAGWGGRWKQYAVCFGG